MLMLAGVETPMTTLVFSQAVDASIYKRVHFTSPDLENSVTIFVKRPYFHLNIEHRYLHPGPLSSFTFP